MKWLLRVIVLLMLTTLITGLLLKFWVLKGMVGWLRCNRALINLKRSQQRGKQSRAGQKVRRTLATAS
ncbi:hypothetical protein Gotur_033981, partial [Gossypium turneri]